MSEWIVRRLSPRRLIIGLIILTFLLSLWFLVSHHHNNEGKEIRLSIDGKKLTISTESRTIKEMLHNEMIPFHDTDFISVPLQAELLDKMNVEIRTAKPFSVMYKGDSYSFVSTANTIEEALNGVGIRLGEHDRTSPNRTGMLNKNEVIQISRFKNTIEKNVESMPIETITIYDDSLPVGESRIAQYGVSSQVMTDKVKRYRNEKLLDEQIINSNVAAGKPHIVVLGTKEKMPEENKVHDEVNIISSNENINSDKQKVLHDFELTAYSAEAPSTGKEKSDPDYRITFSGTTVTEGRTIAVDPNVIPLGWWVYIDGIGYRRAEDTGGAIKGKIIDVFFESEEYCNIFGRKRGYTVTLIGPNKPVEAGEEL